jgi:hypothetical protein
MTTKEIHCCVKRLMKLGYMEEHTAELFLKRLLHIPNSQDIYKYFGCERHEDH